jgi:hypothetical protein
MRDPLSGNYRGRNSLCGKNISIVVPSFTLLVTFIVPSSIFHRFNTIFYEIYELYHGKAASLVKTFNKRGNQNQKALDPILG